MRCRRLAAMVMVPCALAACGDPDASAESSPLDEIFGTAESPAETRAKELEYQESIALCMREEGWEYTPVDYSAQYNDQVPEDPSEPGYGEKYGYGIVRGYEIWEWPYIDEDGNWTNDGPMGGSFEDPNQEYMMALTPDEQQRYNEALSGTYDYEPTIDPETGEEIYESPPIEEQGCYGRAQVEVYGDQPFNDEDFNERFNALVEDLENDPAIEDAEIIWSDCMYEIDADFDFLGPDDTYQYMEALLSEAKGLEQMPIDRETGMVIGGTGEEIVNMVTENEDGEQIGYVGQQRKLTEEQIVDLQAEEVELWRADQECQDESGLRDLRRQLEQDLVDSIREEFPDLLDGDEPGAGG